MSEFDGIYQTPAEQLREAHRKIQAYQKLADKTMNWFLVSTALNVCLAILLFANNLGGSAA